MFSSRLIIIATALLFTLIISCIRPSREEIENDKVDSIAIKYQSLNRDTFKIKQIMNECGAIRKRDQRWRTEYGSLLIGDKMNNADGMSIIDSMNRDDSLNETFLKSITDQYGWPSVYCIGPQCEETLFLVLQHAKLDYQVEMLPFLVNAAYKGDCPRSDIAYLLDRILIKNGRKQYFGTQLMYDGPSGRYIAYPLQYPALVDLLRAKADLGKLAEYLGQFNK